MSNYKGNAINLLGINNIGKTTQQILLEENLKKMKYTVASLKYPLYNLEPTGPRCNDYLRNNNPENLTPLEFQELCVQNRFDFQDTLIGMLNVYDFVILEMYTGSGITFGMSDGIPKDKLIKMNEGLISPDICILLDGERFLDAREEGHNFEKDDEKMNITRQNHLELAKELNWNIVNANQSEQEVHKEIMEIILK